MPFSDPGARAPESVNISGPPDFSTIFPIALKKANSLWKRPGIVKRSSYLGESVICICMAGFAALSSGQLL